MKATTFTVFLFFFFSFCSFASESDSKISTEKETTSNWDFAKKSKSTLIKKQKKLNFKERLALKLIKRKIKKAEKRHKKNNNFIKQKEKVVYTSILLSIFLAIIGVLSGIVFLILGNITTGLLLLFGGAVIVPLVLGIIALIAIFGIKTNTFNE